MSATMRTYTDPTERVAKYYNKIVRRSQKREENREWQRVAREFKGVLYNALPFGQAHDG